MEMRAGRPSRGADFPDHLTLLHDLILLYVHAG